MTPSGPDGAAPGSLFAQVRRVWRGHTHGRASPRLPAAQQTPAAGTGLWPPPGCAPPRGDPRRPRPVDSRAAVRGAEPAAALPSGDTHGTAAQTHADTHAYTARSGPHRHRAAPPPASPASSRHPRLLRMAHKARRTAGHLRGDLPRAAQLPGDPPGCRQSRGAPSSLDMSHSVDALSLSNPPPLRISRHRCHLGLVHPF